MIQKIEGNPIMSFKVGMLLEAWKRKKLVYDKERQSLAQVRFEKETAQFSLKYLDGGTSILYRNTFNQLQPVELHLVPNRKEALLRSTWHSSGIRVRREDVMFGADLLPEWLLESTQKESRQDTSRFTVSVFG